MYIKLSTIYVAGYATLSPKRTRTSVLSLQPCWIVPRTLLSEVRHLSTQRLPSCVSPSKAPLEESEHVKDGYF